MKLLRELSIAMLFSLPLGMVAGYERRCSVNIMQEGKVYYQVDLFKKQFSNEDQNALKFAAITGIANATDAAREYLLPLAPFAHTILRNKYKEECHDGLIVTADCIKLRENLNLIIKAPYLLNELEKQALTERMELKKELPDDAYVTFMFSYSAPDVQLDVKNKLDFTPSEAISSESADAGSSEASPEAPAAD